MSDEIEQQEQQPIRRMGRPPGSRNRRLAELENGEENNGGELEAQSVSIKSALLTEGDNKEYADLAAICEQLSDSNAKVRLYRLGEMGARPYLAEMPVGSFTLEYVKNEFGGGDYIAQFITSNNKFFRKLDFKIDPSFKSRVQRDDDARRLAQQATGGGPIHAQQTDQAALVIQLMQKSADESKQMFQMMLLQAQENSKSMMMVLAKAFEGNNQRRGFGGEATIIDALTPLLLKNMESQARPAGLLDNVDNLLKLKELFAAAEPAEKDDMFDKLIKLVGPVAASFMTRGMQQPAALPPPMPMAAQQHEPPPPPQSVPQIVHVIEQLRGALPLLLNAAQKNSNPETYYEFVSDNLNDELYDQLVTILEKDDWLAVLFENPPVIAANQNLKEWFERLRQLFLEDEAPLENETEIKS